MSYVIAKPEHALRKWHIFASPILTSTSLCGEWRLGMTTFIPLQPPPYSPGSHDCPTCVAIYNTDTKRAVAEDSE